MDSGMLCSAAWVYPRMELEFIAEWLEYHLTVGVEHVFVGLHVNEDFTPPDALLTAKRPYPAMYVLDATEGEVVERFLDAMKPFAPRTTAHIQFRDAEAAVVVDGYVKAQSRFYNAILAKARRERFRWILPHDVDEYIVPQEPYETITAALAACPDDIGAVVAEQVIVEARWDEQRRPRRAPLLRPGLRRCSEVVPHVHGVKSAVRVDVAERLGIHTHRLRSGEELVDRRLLNFHFRGFPAQTEIDTGYRLPIDVQVLDVVDDRPWRLVGGTR